MPYGPFYATTLISQHLVKSWMILFEFTSHPNYKNLMMTPLTRNGLAGGPVVLIADPYLSVELDCSRKLL